MPHRKTPIPEIRKTEIVHHGFFDVKVDTLQLPHGPKLDYTVVNIGAHAAVVIAETHDGKLVVNHEYRHPTKQWLLSCPGGRIDTGESPIETARRELLEETGYGNGTFSILGTVYPFPAVADQQIVFVHAQGVSYLQPPALEDFELIHPQLIIPEDLCQAIASGAPVDGILCTALFLWSIPKQRKI